MKMLASHGLLELFLHFFQPELVSVEEHHVVGGVAVKCLKNVLDDGVSRRKQSDRVHHGGWISEKPAKVMGPPRNALCLVKFFGIRSQAEGQLVF